MAKKKHNEDFSPDITDLEEDTVQTDSKDEPDHDAGPENAEPKAEPEEGTEKSGDPDELELMKRKLAEESNKYLRLLAEYDNFRKRSVKEKDQLYNEAKADTIAKLLPVYDNLELATKNHTDDEAYAKGVELTLSGFQELLGKMGVTETGAVGEAFDPEQHNAVMHIQDEELGESVIAEVFQKGFLLSDRVIRHAMVKVAN